MLKNTEKISEMNRTVFIILSLIIHKDLYKEAESKTTYTKGVNDKTDVEVKNDRKQYLQDHKIMKKRKMSFKVETWFKTERKIFGLESDESKMNNSGHSQVQIWANNYCNMMSNLIKNSARFKQKDGVLNCYCIEDMDLLYSSETPECISNCGELVRCKGSANSFDEKVEVEMHLIQIQIKTYCKISQIQESLDALCNENSVSRVDSLYNVKCYEINYLNFNENGSCLDDCRNIIECKGSPINKQLGKLIDHSKIEWNALTNGCPCSEDIDVNGVYRGCQDVSIPGDPCVEWISSVPSQAAEYKTRFKHPDNYCSALEKTEGIWCPTPNNRITKCVPKDLEEVNIQSGTVFDLWISPYIPRYKFKIMFIDTYFECGGVASSKTQNITNSYKNEIFNLTKDSRSVAEENDLFEYPDSSFEDPSYVFRGFFSMEKIGSSSKICACMYSTYYENVNGSNSNCSRKSDFTITIGKLNIDGNTVPNIIEHSSNSVSLNSVVNMEGIISLVNEDVAIICRKNIGSNSEICRKSIDKIMEIEKMDRKIKVYNPEIDRSIDFKYNQQIIYRNTVKAVEKVQLLLEKAGDYSMINQRIVQDDSENKIIYRLSVKGYYANKKFKIIIDNEKERRYREQSLFFDTWKVKYPPLAVIISKYTGNQNLCSQPFAYSINIFPVVNSVVDLGKTTWRASDFQITKRLSEITETVDRFEVCAYTIDSEVQKMGYGIFTDFVNHELNEILPITELKIPNDVFNYKIYDEFDIIQFHINTNEDKIFTYSNTISRITVMVKNYKRFVGYMKSNSYEGNLENIEGDSDEINSNKYPAILSFWTYPDENLVRMWMFRPNRLSPSYIGQIEVKSPLSFGVYTSLNKLMGVVLSEGELGITLYEIELDKNQENENKFNLMLRKTSCSEHSASCTKLLSPVDMKIIKYYDDCVERHFIIVSDVGLNCIILYNSALIEVSKLCRDHGLSKIFEPHQISCADSSYDMGQCINTFDEFKYDSQDNSRFVNCFITQPYDGTILWVKVNLLEQKLVLVDSYSGGEIRDDLMVSKEQNTKFTTPSLLKPISIETVSYGKIILIYIVESENPSVVLLTLNLSKDISKIAYYGRTELEMISYGNFFHINKLLMSGRYNDKINDQEYLMLFRVGARGNQNDSKGFESINIINIKDTISISNFEYITPEWIVMGEQINLLPKIELGNKKNLLLYELDILNEEPNPTINESNVQNESYFQNINPNSSWDGNSVHKNVITIDKKTGEIKILINYVHMLNLHLKVTCYGFIESKTISFSFKVACMDGYYFTGTNNNTTNDETTGCSYCDQGEFNSLHLIKTDIVNWNKCSKCPFRETTVTKGSTSITQCLCSPGYEFTGDATNRCEPCKAGTWKSSVGLQSCSGSGCYNNSFSNKIGSISEEDRECSCHEGFYFVVHSGGIKECIPCEEGFYCPGGIKGNKMQCPTNTTTSISLLDDGSIKSLPLSITECSCKKGYERVDYIYMLDINSPEYKLKEKIEEELKLMNLGNQKYDINEFVCAPCGHRKYKDTVGSSKCKDCPENTFSESMSPNSIEQCNLCDPGYYESDDENQRCKECIKDHFCVGSEPNNENLKIYAKKKMMCTENSITIKPYELNTSILNCLCVEGYVSVMNGFLLKCIPAPKDHYKDVVGNVEATPCPYGSLTMFNGATSKDSCVCDKGTYFDSQAQHCTVCPAGRYCLGGKDQNNEDVQPMDCGDVNALTKAAGASSSSECACRAGYYMDVDSQDTCKECPENHYKSYVSNDQCTRCDDNSSTSGKKGATSKEQCVCDPGYYFDNACVSCSFKDKYCPGGVIETTDALGQTRIVTQSPVSCPQNTEIEPGVDNASSISFCKCTRGYSFVSENLAMNLKQCAPCVPGTYKSSVMDSSCNGLCTQNATSLHGAVSSNQCFCQPNYFYLEGGICSKCMEGARCAGGLINETEMRVDSNLVVDIDDHVKPVAIEGYYLDKINANLRKPDDWKFIRCPISGACLGEDRCSRSMEHYLCSECKRGYTNNFVKGALCQQCPRMVPNLSLTIVYYLVLLLVNIVMACLNISAGFNRRSIHSVVIKIALNFAICTSVINVINFGDLKLPEGLKRLTSSWIKVFDSEDIVYYTSLDCLLRQLFGLEHAQSFFYAMLYMAFLPIILLIIVTLLMLLILSLFKIRRYRDTRTKLALLQQAEVQGMDRIAEGLTEQYQNERLLMIFRYIPLPGQTRWVKFRNFLEDMIPIYVTVLFSVHGKITSRMLSLLDCTYIDLGRSFPGKYMLRPAMSVKCSLNPADGYLKYLVLGLGGLLVWGFGIPFLSFMVLYVNRKNLYDPGIRMKYGFLHNGFRQDYWYWETIVFTRKCLVLVIGSIVIVPSQNYSGSRIWMALVVAVTFLIIQLIYKPFDERDYFVLGRLENHSMIAWTFTLILFSFIIEANFSSSFNISFLSVIVLLNSLFISEIIFQFLISYSYNIQSQYQQSHSIFSSFINFFTKISTKLKNAEPIIYFDNVTFSTNLRSSNIISGGSTFWIIRNIKYYEKLYFSHVMTEIISFAHSRMKLDIIPFDFPEFITRLTFAVHFNEYAKQRTDIMVKSFADGNIDQLVNLSMNIKNYTETKDDKKYNRNRYFEDTDTIVNTEMMFDKDVLTSGIPLSDFYIALSIIKLKDFKSIGKTYIDFKNYKSKMKSINIEYESKKLKELNQISNNLESEVSAHNIDTIFCSEEELEDLYKKIDSIKSKIAEFKNDPLKALKMYQSDDYEHLEIGDFDTDMVNFGFTKTNIN